MKKTKLVKYLKFMGKKTTQKTLRIMYWKLSKNCVVHVVISIALYITIIKVVLAAVALSISPLVKWVSPESRQLYHPWENFLEKKGKKKRTKTFSRTGSQVWKEGLPSFKLEGFLHKQRTDITSLDVKCCVRLHTHCCMLLLHVFPCCWELLRSFARSLTGMFLVNPAKWVGFFFAIHDVNPIFLT